MTAPSRVRRYGLPLLGAITLAAVLAAPFAAHRHRLGHLYPKDHYVAPERHPALDAEAFAPYAGSESCRDCHREAYDLWRTSNHAMAERLPDPARDDTAFAPTGGDRRLQAVENLEPAVPAGHLFNPAVPASTIPAASRTFQHGTQSTSVGGSNGLYRVATLGLSGHVETTTVARVIGHDPLRQFLVPFPGGRLQTLEASFDPLRNDWFNVYGEEDRQPGEWGHWTGRGMNWNNMCAACHNTRVRKNYDPATDTYRTTMAEMTVGCEACHGPLKDHVAWRRAHTNAVTRDPTIPPLTPQQNFETCATCHARRMELTGDFVPGDRFDDHHVLTLVDGTDTYYADGQVREENYEYAAFLGSRMANAGIRCADCHQVHSAKTLLPGNLLCMRCHAPGSSYTNAPIIDPVAHGFHKVDPRYGIPNMEQALAQARLGAPLPPPLAIPDTEALARRERLNVWKDGGECVNCHMPQTYYMQRHRRHDHGQTIPDPLLTRQYGIPNACNRCHTDKSVDWALEWTQAWYGDRMDRPYRRRAQVIAAARNNQPGARDGLLTMLTSDTNAYWQAVAAGLLRPWSADPPVAAALQAALSHSNALVRAQSVSALAAGPHAQKLLDDPVRAVRHAAAWAQRGELEADSQTGRELRAVLDYVADQPLGQMQAGAYYLARGDLAQAAAHYRTAVEWDPNAAAIRHDFAVVLSMQGDSAAAVQQLEAACRLEPGSGEFRYKLALAWNEAGRTELAVANLQEAVRLEPAHGRAWYNLGLASAGAERLPDAVDALRRATDLIPGPDAPYALATVLARQNHLTAARTALAEALRRDPTHAPSRQLQADLEAARHN
ncbi:MAG: tetratricopeptide repeat protein [Lentisphaerae bacterium]|nr:tetratricopeptide repeat protein [Lentisphaerota bacterium]